MPFGNRKFILEDLFSSVMSQFKKYHTSGNPKFNYLGIFQSLKFRNLMGETLRISLKRNFTPNSLGCSGLKWGQKWPFGRNVIDEQPRNLGKTL